MDQIRRLVGEMEHLREELAALELGSGAAVGWDLLKLQGQKTELRATMATKLWRVCELQLQEEGKLPVLGIAEYLVEPEDSDYKVKLWKREGEVVACEIVAWNTSAGGYISVSGYGTGAESEHEKHYLLVKKTQSITKQEFNRELDLALAWSGIQWRFADYSVQPITYSSTWETLTHWFRTQNPGGWHGHDDLKVPKLGRRPLRPTFTKCRVCGYTNDDCSQCIAASGQACSWKAPYLCSRCYYEQNPLEAYAEWIRSLSKKDFCQEYTSVYMTWKGEVHNYEHDTEEKMEACRAEEKRRGINVEIL